LGVKRKTGWIVTLGTFNQAPTTRASLTTDGITEASGNAQFNKSDARMCWNASWMTICIMGLCIVSMSVKASTGLDSMTCTKSELVASTLKE